MGLYGAAYGTKKNTEKSSYDGVGNIFVASMSSEAVTRACCVPLRPGTPQDDPTDGGGFSEHLDQNEADVGGVLLRISVVVEVRAAHTRW